MTRYRENTDYHRHYRRTFTSGPDSPGADRGPALHPWRMGGGISEICCLPVCAGGSLRHKRQEAGYPAAHERHRPAGGSRKL
uniref:Uncharacterized protein n=1 Tax=Siphoviridae sp. ctsAY3 TaxID=2827281 RepID=A0A8S5R4C3_9CAUD|nr:MAG TPA: hypothetical protein [Siphoviridae sp. ctsAY3]